VPIKLTPFPQTIRLAKQSCHINPLHGVLEKLGSDWGCAYLHRLVIMAHLNKGRDHW